MTAPQDCRAGGSQPCGQLPQCSMYCSAARAASDFGGGEELGWLCLGERDPLPPCTMLSRWAGKAAVAHVAVEMLLFLLTLYSPTAWVCGVGGLASCPTAPEHLGFICTGSQCARHWDPSTGYAVPTQMAVGVGEGLGRGGLGFESVEQYLLGGEFFSTEEKQIWVNQPREQTG